MYVGQTGKSKPEYRWGDNGAGYLNKKNGKYCQPAFAHAILKYGWDNFQHEVIANNITKEEADTFEKLLIEKLNTIDSKYGYNCKEGGSRGKFSEDTRKKMSESHKGEKSYLYGKHLSSSVREKISNSRKGQYLSENVKRKLSDAFKGDSNPFYSKHHTEESRRKISENKKKLTGAKHPRARKVAQYDSDGNLLKIWDCMKEAGKELRINHANIYSCCKYNRKFAGGFIWRYYEDIENSVKE